MTLHRTILQFAGDGPAVTGDWQDHNAGASANASRNPSVASLYRALAEAD